MQADISTVNQTAWNTGRYDAWTKAFGAPTSAAEIIRADPAYPIRRILPALGSPESKRICSVQGSHGRVAVALAMTGAKVQVIDFSHENRRYALELAQAAGVSIDYAVADVMQAATLDLPQKFDALVLEYGILHYHLEIERFFAVMRTLVATDAVLILNEFHPVQRKLYWSAGPGDYFGTGIVAADVPNPDITGPSLGTCHYRFWTMAEILNAIIASGFTITHIDEHPDEEDERRPGTFTLTAKAAELARSNAPEV